MEHGVFIAHSDDDGEVASTLCAALEDRGVRCWVSARDLDPKQHPVDLTQRAVIDADFVLAIVSAGSTASPGIVSALGVATSRGTQIIVVPKGGAVPAGKILALTMGAPSIAVEQGAEASAVSRILDVMNADSSDGEPVPPNDVFVGFRMRFGGSEASRHVVRVLRAAKLRVLHVNDFPSTGLDKLLDWIESAKTFVSVLTERVFEDCHEPDNWVRREIEHALSTGRTIVPAWFDGFDPKSVDLPQEIAEILNIKAVVVSEQDFDAGLQRIVHQVKKAVAAYGADGLA